MLLLDPFRFGAAPAAAPIAHVQSPAKGLADDASSLLKSFAAPVAAGNRIVVCVAIFNDGGVASHGVTDSLGNAYAKHAEEVDTDGLLSIWSAPVASAGPCTVTLSTDPGSYLFMTVSEFSGLAPAAVLDAADGNSGTGTAPQASGGALVTSQQHTLLVALFNHESPTATAQTPGPGFTLIDKEDDGTLHQTGCSAYRISSTPGGNAMTGTLAASRNWGFAGIALKRAE